MAASSNLSKFIALFCRPIVGKGNPQSFRLIVRGSGLGFGTHTADDRRAVSLDCLLLGVLCWKRGQHRNTEGLRQLAGSMDSRFYLKS